MTCLAILWNTIMALTFLLNIVVRYALVYCRLCGQSAVVRQLGCFWGDSAAAGDATVYRTLSEPASARHPAEGHHQPTGAPIWNTRFVEFTCRWLVGQWDRNNDFMHRLGTSPAQILLQVPPIPYLWLFWFLSLAIIIALLSEVNRIMLYRCFNLGSGFLHVWQAFGGWKVKGPQLEALEINIYMLQISLHWNMIRKVCFYVCTHTHRCLYVYFSLQ